MDKREALALIALKGCCECGGHVIVMGTIKSNISFACVSCKLAQSIQMRVPNYNALIEEYYHEPKRTEAYTSFDGMSSVQWTSRRRGY